MAAWVRDRFDGRLAIAVGVCWLGVVAPAGAARLGLVPLAGDGAVGRLTYFSGSQFEPSTAYVIRVGGPGGATAAAVSDALGAIP